MIAEMIRKISKTVLVLIFGIFLSSCASLEYRADSPGFRYYVHEGVYPGTRFNTQMIGDILTDQQDPFMKTLWPIFLTIHVADLPLSAALDTICLPYDIFQKPRVVAPPLSENSTANRSTPK